MELTCLKCGCSDVNPADEGSWASCNDCGFVQYDADTLALMHETRREYEQAKQECWPDPVPSYKEWMNREENYERRNDR